MAGQFTIGSDTGSDPIEFFEKIGSPGRITRRCAPRPFGAAVAKPPAFNLACGQVVEPSCFLSAVRIWRNYRLGREVAWGQQLFEIGSPGRILYLLTEGMFRSFGVF
jgi:hypothetical protein